MRTDISMREQGTITRWIDTRGFGFVKPDRPGDGDIFVHIKKFPPFAVPDVEMRVEYETADDRGRVKAVNVRLVT
jgi:cold shock CspA family protein